MAENASFEVPVEPPIKPLIIH